MKWNTIRGEGLRCSVCGHTATEKSDDERDLFYFPNANSMTREQADQIENIWDVDPYADFLVCHSCVDGHQGHDPYCRPDDWLEDWAKEGVQIRRR